MCGIQTYLGYYSEMCRIPSDAAAADVEFCSLVRWTSSIGAVDHSRTWSDLISQVASFPRSYLIASSGDLVSLKRTRCPVLVVPTPTTSVSGVTMSLREGIGHPGIGWVADMYLVKVLSGGGWGLGERTTSISID